MSPSRSDRSEEGVRILRVVLGDQLDPDLPLLDEADRDADLVWMAEVPDEIDAVPSHRLRIAVFLSAMRHHARHLEEKGFRVRYETLPEAGSGERSFAHRLGPVLEEVAPEGVEVTHPGDHRVLEAIRSATSERDIPLTVRDDTRFYATLPDFERWMEDRSSPVLEDFYREMRRRHDVLLTDDGEPVGDRWNFDEDNRENLKPDGPGDLPERPRWPLDEVDREVLELVEARFGDHPGTAEHLDQLPRTPEQAREALDFFLEHHLPDFGTYQDALWSDEPFLHHSRLSVPLNLGLLDPRACVDGAVEAYRDDRAPLNAVEGFVRQILGWREFVRGVYWLRMPAYAEGNALEAERDVPGFFWDGETDMECVAQAMAGVLDHAYAHHIQRLMVLGLFALLYGSHPRRVNDWHLAMYADAVDWVSLPNVLGMSQYADGGFLATKPYCASGRYIQRMSDHCRHCPYDPAEGAGEDACPFTTLYWDFLDRHEDRLRSNHRMGFQYRNVDRKREKGELQPILDRARWLKGWVTRGERI